MFSVSQAASAVGSFGLVFIGGMVWWYSSTADQASALHKDYLDMADEVEVTQYKLAALKDECDDLTDTKLRLELREKKRKQLATGDKKQLGKLENAVKALSDQMDGPRQRVNFLSYALATAGTEREDTEEIALGQLETARIAVKELSEQGGVVVVKGEALFAEDVSRFAERLKAAGYLTRVKVNDVVQKADQTIQKVYVEYRISAIARNPRSSQRVDSEGKP